MSIIRTDLSARTDEQIQAIQKQYQQYQKEYESILSRLIEELEVLRDAASTEANHQSALINWRGKKAKRFINSALTPLNKEGNDVFFNQERLDITKHPEIWTLKNGFGTKRIGASDLHIENKANFDSSNTSTYESIRIALYDLLKQKSYFPSTAEKKAIKKINRTLDRIEQLQKQQSSDYLQRLRDETAEALITQLINQREYLSQMTLEERRKRNDLIKRIEEIKKIKGSQLRFSADALEKTKEVNKLRNDILEFNINLLKFNKKPNEEVNQLAKQLSVVTKAWLDPFYSDPKELSTLDKVRYVIKWTSLAVTAIAGVGAILSLIFFPPAFPVFALVGLAGMLPTLDTIIEVTRNLYHGRTPTKAQTLDLGVSLSLIAFLVTAANVVPAIGNALVNKSDVVISSLGKSLVDVGMFFKLQFNQYFNAIANGLASIFVGKNLKGTITPPPKSEDKLDQHAQVDINIYRQMQIEQLGEEQNKLLATGSNQPSNEGKKETAEKQEIAENQEIVEHQKTQNLPASQLMTKNAGQILAAKLTKDNDLDKTHLRFAFFNQGNLQFYTSLAGLISAWDTRFFKGFTSLEAQAIYDAAVAYCRLSANATINDRMGALKGIQEKIAIWKNDIADEAKEKEFIFREDLNKRTSRRLPKVLELEKLVNKEISTLENINNKSDKLTLVYKK